MTNKQYFRKDNLHSSRYHVGVYYESLEYLKAGHVIEIWKNEENFTGYTDYVLIDEIIEVQKHENDMMAKLCIVLVKGVTVNNLFFDKKIDTILNNDSKEVYLYYSEEEKEEICSNILFENNPALLKYKDYLQLDKVIQDTDYIEVFQDNRIDEQCIGVVVSTKN